MVLHIVAWVSFAVGWLRGGHTERFAMAVLFCDYALTGLFTGMAHEFELVAASAFVIALIFAWMAFRSDRWWMLVAAAALALCALVFVLDWTNPALGRNAAISAQIGLWFFVYVSLLAGVMERWLAGEPAVGDAATWRRRISTS